MLITENPYHLLAERLDALPNGFPSTPDGAELRLLEKLFTPQEAALAAQLRMSLETPAEVAARLGGDPKEIRQMLKSMTQRGLIRAGRAEKGLGYGLLPFVVGFYENQNGRMDTEMARLFEDYYRQAFGTALAIQPAFHRVIPVGESVRVDMEVHPFESAASLIAGAQSWGVIDCICRTQKALIGQACEHPRDNCMVLSKQPGAFQDSTMIRPLTQEGALAVLKQAARAGLVHSVSNSQGDLGYICNCCTCSCGILRGMADLGIANVVARSAFVNQVDETLCQACGDCLEACMFSALSLAEIAQVDRLRCVGCGVCVLVCPEDALALVRRPEEEIKPVPVNHEEWQVQRAQARKIDIRQVL